MTARGACVRVWRGRRGMEAMQTVLILGTAFVAVVGLRQAYKTHAETQLAGKTAEIIGGEKSDGGSDKPGTTGKNPAGSPELAVESGQFTFDNEGTEGGKNHTRKPHVPTDESGLTVGRGYDMKERTAKGIKADLMAAGLSEEDAALYAKAAGLSGADARKFIKDNKLPELTLAQQKELFKRTYAWMESDVKRICEKLDTVGAYGATDWKKLDPAIKTLITDLRFRGDYNTETRKFLQPLIVANDVVGLAKVMADRTKWPKVPAQRFDNRKEFANDAAKAAKPKP